MYAAGMDRVAFKDFVLCKALDVVSGNCAYRKYLHQCCENGEDWALKVSANVASVAAVIKELHALVDRVKRLPNSKLGKVNGDELIGCARLIVRAGLRRDRVVYAQPRAGDPGMEHM